MCVGGCLEGVGACMGEIYPCPPVRSDTVTLRYLFLQSRLSLVNPGHEHLSSDELNLPTLYIFGSIVWGILLICWVANAFYHRKVSVTYHLTYQLSF